MAILMLTFERSVASPLFLRTDPTGFFRLLLIEDKIKNSKIGTSFLCKNSVTT